MTTYVPKIKNGSKLTIGRNVIILDRHLNWFQKKMYSKCKIIRRIVLP